MRNPLRKREIISDGNLHLHKVVKNTEYINTQARKQ